MNVNRVNHGAVRTGAGRGRHNPRRVRMVGMDWTIWVVPPKMEAFVVRWKLQPVHFHLRERRQKCSRSLLGEAL